MFSFNQAIGLFFFEAVLILLSVTLGGWLVFKTKREPHETLVGGAPKGDIFSIDDSEEDIEDGITDIPDAITAKANAFFDQTGGDI